MTVKIMASKSLNFKKEGLRLGKKPNLERLV